MQKSGYERQKITIREATLERPESSSITHHSSFKDGHLRTGPLPHWEHHTSSGAHGFCKLADIRAPCLWLQVCKLQTPADNYSYILLIQSSHSISRALQMPAARQ